MGYMRHHAILVTDHSYGDHAERAHAKASRLFPAGGVTALSTSVVNGYKSFAVLPDGSKEGWEEDLVGDAAREAFIGWLRAQACEDGSSPLSWAEVQYGDDEGDSRVLSHSDDGLPAPAPRTGEEERDG